MHLQCFDKCLPSVGVSRARTIALAIVGIGAVAGCDVNSALERLSEARRLSADLHIQFTKAADASNRAVMADADEMSLGFAREAQQASAVVQQDVDALAPLLQGLGFSSEAGLLDEFRAQFAAYQKLDRTILELAVENTNLKARRLSFGSAMGAADELRDALEALSRGNSGQQIWQIKALAATATASVREIQAIQAPHIADPDDAAMAKMEERMALAEVNARSPLKTLATLVPPSSKADVARGASALDRFMDLNKQIVALSRRNTNVRSLALALNDKGKLTSECESRLRALQEALSKRGFTGTR